MANKILQWFELKPIIRCIRNKTPALSIWPKLSHSTLQQDRDHKEGKMTNDTTITMKNAADQKQPRLPTRSFPEMTFKEFDRHILQKLELNTQSLLPSTSQSFADYINHSKTLQGLVSIGVELYKIQRSHPELMQPILTADLQRDIKPRLQFLLRKGFTHQELPSIITRNPKILHSDIDLNECYDYLSEKMFTEEDIGQLVIKCPTILTIPAPNLDGILGFFQKIPTNNSRTIAFSNKQIRNIILRYPVLITSDLYSVYEQVRTLEISCGFSLAEIRSLIYGFPLILTKDETQLELLYKFYTRVMKYNNQNLVKCPEAFSIRIKVVQERHQYLEYMEKAQYCEDETRYIPLKNVIMGSNKEFCENCGVGSVESFVNFLKTV